MRILWIFILLGIGQLSIGQGVVINEFLASSDSLSGIADEFGEYDDWIELYNNSSEAIDLSGYYLSDNFETPEKWQFPAGISIEGNGFLIIWADNDDEQGDLHTPYKLNKQGEEILLSDPDLNLLDSISYGEQETNVSMARIPNGSGDFVPQAPTFNAENGTVTTGDLVVRTDFSLFPNPATNVLNLDFSATDGAGITDAFLLISDVSGKVQFTQKYAILPEQLSVDVSGLSSGLYLVRIESKGFIFIKPMTIQQHD